MKNILNFTRVELQKELLSDFPEAKRFHADELFKWVYGKKVFDFSKMTNLSKVFREKLPTKYSISHSDLSEMLEDKEDGTKKLIITLQDGLLIESVIITQDDRVTLCVSSQVGCAMKCSFCLTGEMGFKRNLEVYEIIDQLKEALEISKITNIVFMGMGEPLLNIENVGKAIEIMEDQFAFGFGKRRITVSTSGIIPGILELPKYGDPNLAVSLNTTNEELRSDLMPINKKYPLKELLKVLREYPLKIGRRITFEYVLIKNINDSIEDAKELIKFLKKVPSKLNLICFNEFSGTRYSTPDENTVKNFQKFLRDNGIQVNLRESKGRNILAACGQLQGR